MAAEKLPETPELLNGRFPAKFPGKCNICNRPINKGDIQMIDPKKPQWFNSNSQKWTYNRVHPECREANDRQMGRAPEPAVKPYSFAPGASKKGDLNALFTAVRDALNDYLGEIDADDAYAKLDGEIPL